MFSRFWIADAMVLCSLLVNVLLDVDVFVVFVVFVVFPEVLFDALEFAEVLLTAVLFTVLFVDDEFVTAEFDEPLFVVNEFVDVLLTAVLFTAVLFAVILFVVLFGRYGTTAFPHPAKPITIKPAKPPTSALLFMCRVSLHLSNSFRLAVSNLPESIIVHIVIR